MLFEKDTRMKENIFFQLLLKSLCIAYLKGKGSKHRLEEDSEGISSLTGVGE